MAHGKWPGRWLGDPAARPASTIVVAFLLMASLVHCGDISTQSDASDTERNTRVVLTIDEDGNVLAAEEVSAEHSHRSDDTSQTESAAQPESPVAASDAVPQESEDFSQSDPSSTEADLDAMACLVHTVQIDLQTGEVCASCAMENDGNPQTQCGNTDWSCTQHLSQTNDTASPQTCWVCAPHAGGAVVYSNCPSKAPQDCIPASWVGQNPNEGCEVCYDRAGNAVRETCAPLCPSAEEPTCDDASEPIETSSTRIWGSCQNQCPSTTSGRCDGVACGDLVPLPQCPNAQQPIRLADDCCLFRCPSEQNP